MAARKKPGTAVAARKSTSPANAAAIRKALETQAAGIKDRIGSPETQRISLNDKVFTFPDGQVIQGSITAVILDFLNWNQYYVGNYDPKNTSPPVCFAQGEQLKGMAPSKNAPEPQADACDGCPKNEFGSGTGDGKACKNQRRLALIMDGEDPEDGPIYTLNVPAASLKAFDGYVGTVARLYNMPPIAVKTTISFHPDSVYAKLIFEKPEPNPDLMVHYNRIETARQLLQVEPDVSNYEPSKKPTRRGRR